MEAVELGIAGRIDHALDILDVEPVSGNIHVDAAMNEFGRISDCHRGVWSIDAAFRMLVEKLGEGSETTDQANRRGSSDSDTTKRLDRERV